MKWPWQRSIQARIVLILAGLLSAVLVLVNFEMGKTLRAAQLEETANHLQIQALLAAATLQDPLSGYRQELENHKHDDEPHEEESEPHHIKESLLASWADSYTRESGARVSIWDRTGRPIVQSEPLDPREMAAAGAGQPYHRWTAQTVYASAPISRSGEFLGLIQLSSPRSAATARSRALILRMALASVLALGLVLVMSIWLSRRLVGPLKRLEASALRLSQGDWDQVVEVEGDDELASLSKAFVTMRSKLHVIFEQQRRFVSHASHELRTPLTRIKLRTEALVDGGLEDPKVAEKFVREVDSEADRLTRLANALLDLSRLEEAQKNGKTSDPIQVLRKTTEAAGATHVNLILELPDTLPPVRLSPENLELLLTNLLENALKHTPEGGEIRVSALRGDSGITLSVQDNGQGIAAEHLSHLFERFYRADPARTRGGTGLGLALVKAAAEAAGGSVRVTSQLGQGSRFMVELPTF